MKKVRQSLANQTLFGNAILMKDKLFLVDKLHSGLLQIWVNGQLIQGQQTVRSLEEAFCASKLDKPKACTSAVRHSLPLHQLINYNQPKARKSNIRKLLRYCLAIASLSAVLYFCLRSLWKNAPAPQHSRVQSDSVEEEDLNASDRFAHKIELA